MDYSLPGSSVHGIFQAIVLKWVAISFSRGTFPTQVSNPGFPHCRQTLCHLSHQSCTERIRAAIKAMSLWFSGWPPCLCRVTRRWVSASQGKGCNAHCPPRPPGREGRMVVLSLVLGLSKQDDFANIPDLQNPGTQQNQNAQGDKRYEHRRGPAAAVAEEEAWRGSQPRPPAAGQGSGTFCGCWSGRTTPPQLAPSHLPRWWCPLGLRPVWLSWDHSGSSLLPGPACSLDAPCFPSSSLTPPGLSFLGLLREGPQCGGVDD